MNKVFIGVGAVVCAGGGFLLCLFVLGLLLYLVCLVWVDFSNKFRDICKAESLIFEYRRHRNEFMEWLKARDLQK